MILSIIAVVPITDTVAPVVTCPANQQANLAFGQAATGVNYPPATATDNSGGFVALSYSHPSGSSFSRGNTVVTVTGRDPSGNIGQCTFVVMGKFRSLIKQYECIPANAPYYRAHTSNELADAFGMRSHSLVCVDVHFRVLRVHALFSAVSLMINSGTVV